MSRVHVDRLGPVCIILQWKKKFGTAPPLRSSWQLRLIWWRQHSRRCQAKLHLNLTSRSLRHLASYLRHAPPAKKASLFFSSSPSPFHVNVATGPPLNSLYSGSWRLYVPFRPSWSSTPPITIPWACSLRPPSFRSRRPTASWLLCTIQVESPFHHVHMGVHRERQTPSSRRHSISSAPSRIATLH